MKRAEQKLDNTVAILDAGAQYGFDIEQKIKRLGFRAEKLPFNTPAKDLKGYGALILSGGPESVYDETAPKYDPEIFSLDKPLLGICYGMQLINHVMGGEVKPLGRREDGYTTVKVQNDRPIFSGLNPEEEVIMSHGDSILKLAPGFEQIAASGGIIAAMAAKDRPVFGLQFHPEVSLPAGPKILDNFLTKIAGLEGGYKFTIGEFAEEAIAEIKDEAGGREVLAFVSGGVDSATLAKLLEEALPREQVHLVFIDTGFMRQNEPETVKEQLKQAGIDIEVFDAAEIFAKATIEVDGQTTPPLNEVTDPETKRQIIGDTFIRVREEMAKKLGLDPDTYILAQGTLFTDLIESGSKEASQAADTIKSHHNDSAQVRRLRGDKRVIEPLKVLQKDDVRELAKHLGLPEAIARRQPFPGPGLAIRVICAEGPYMEDDYSQISEALGEFKTDEFEPVLLPVRTVGVQGDKRTYRYLAGISGKKDWPKLVALAREIPRKVHGVNRLVYIFGEPVKGPVKEVTPTHLAKDTVSQLREIDHAANAILKRHGLDRSLSQVPIIMFPVNFGQAGGRSIGIRTFMTENYKTGDIAVPGKDIPEKVLDEIVVAVLKFPGISRVVYDLTSKPPATTEWE